jgi:hypothetical protein
VRYHSDGKELRRQRLFEKALDVCATSPFARFVQRWVLAGVGHGARLAAIVGSRARGNVCGYMFVAYPVAVSEIWASNQWHVPVCLGTCPALRKVCQDAVAARDGTGFSRLAWHSQSQKQPPNISPSAVHTLPWCCC